MAEDMDYGNDPRNPKGPGDISGKAVDGAPGATIPSEIRSKWNPGGIPARAAQSEADDSRGLGSLNPPGARA